MRVSVEVRHFDPSEALLLSGNVTGSQPASVVAHWLPNVVRSAYGENACLCCVEGSCCEKGPLVGR